MAQRLAGMALGIEAEIRVELLETAAQQRHFLDRPAKRLAGPQPRMHTDARDLPLLSKGYDNEVERNPAVHGRLALGLGHQGNVAAFFKIAHRAERSALIGRQSWNAEDSQRVSRLALRSFDLVTEQSHGPVGEPFEKRATFGVLNCRCVLAHLRLELGPVTNGRANVSED